MRAVHVHSLHIRIMLIFALAFFFVSTALVSDSSAVEIIQSPEIIYAGYPFKMTAFSETCYDTQHTCPTFTVGWTYNYSGRYGSNFNGLSLTLPAMTYQGDWLVYQFNLNNSRSTSANHSSFLGLTRDSSNANLNFDVVSYRFEQLTDNDSLLTVYIKMKGEQTVTNSESLNGLRMVGSSGSWLQLQAPSNAVNGVQIVTMSLNVFRDMGSTDYSTSINAINNKLGTTNTKLDSVNGNLNDLKSLQEQANDDANDRYEDEKDTINQNGDEAVDSWDDAQSNLSFQAPTFLFGWLWSLGSVEDCVDISVLASIIHSPETQYCTWYPTSIRSIVSPIINIFLVCLISGFVFSWLKKGGV